MAVGPPGVGRERGTDERGLAAAQCHRQAGRAVSVVIVVTFVNANYLGWDEL